MRYINSYATSGDVQTALDNGTLGKPYVAYVESGQYIDWNSNSVTPDYSTIPLTFEAQSDGAIKWVKYDSGMYDPVTIQYSKNGGAWTNLTNTVTGAEIQVSTGDYVQVKCSNYLQKGFFSSTCQFKLYGNIMSLVDGDNFSASTTINNSLEILFENCTGLTNASNLVLAATNLSSNCYQYMFAGCTNMTGATPELPATTLRQFCYSHLFDGCGINYIKCLAENFYGASSFNDCMGGWVDNIPATGTIVKKTGVNIITPSGWTVVEI